jgi:hypothetical protein
MAWYFCILLLSCNCQDWTTLQHKTYRGLAWMAEGLLQGGETLSDPGLRWAQRRTPIFFGKVTGWVTLGSDWIIPQAVVEVDCWLMVKDGLTVLSQPGVFENN